MKTSAPQPGQYTYTAPSGQRVTLTVSPSGDLIAMTRDGAAALPHLLPQVQRAVYAELQDAQDAARLPLGLPALAFTPALGKPRACNLHRLMARAGLPSGAHYDFAARALGRPVNSLAALTLAEARAVWRALQGRYPHIQTPAPRAA